MAGRVLLSVWAVLNLVVGLGVTVATLVGPSTPVLELTFSAAELPQLDARLVAVVKAQAMLLNPLIVAVCTFSLTLTWGPVRRGERWAWSALTATLLPVQLFGFVSDTFLANNNLVANLVSSVILMTGLALMRPGRTG